MEEPLPHPILLELEAEAKCASLRPVGRLLSVLVHCMQANRILEIGTGCGYATLWMSLALPPAGRIWTVDPDIERTQLAQKFFERASVSERIEVINQPAREVLPTFPQRNVDIAYVDAPQHDYAAYLNGVLPLLKLSGLIVLYGDLQAAEAFRERLLTHPDLDATILPIGSGVAIGARKR